MNILNLHYNQKLLFRIICTMILIICFIVVVRPDNTRVSAESNRTLTCSTVRIQENDSLWSIARRYYSDEYGSIYNQIEAIKETNNLTSDKIIKGYNLVIPYYK